MKTAFLSILAAMILVSVGSFAKADDVYQNVYNNVDKTKLVQLLKDMSGVNPVTVDGATFSITDRYLPASKANFRKYWMAYFKSLGMQVNELDYATQYNLETQGHNLEAVLPGLSADSIVVIVHYDSTGPHGADNAGTDDDMTGMAMLMETARILNQYKGHLTHTVRFVAADYEEWGDLEGAKQYVSYLQGLAKAQNFKIVASVDDEQSGWKEGANQIAFFTYCGPNPDLDKPYANLFAQTVAKYSKMTQVQDCMGENSDFAAFSEVGIPGEVFSENDPFSNPHFDAEGGDTFDKIDQDYFFSISQVGVTYSAEMVGLQ